MGADSRIEWCQHTFNPFIGCTKVSPACDHCYAESWAKRSGLVVWGGERRRTSAGSWRLPLKWNAQAEREGRRFRVFCASLADVFDKDVPAEWRDDLWRLIESTPNLDWLLLTKRVGNVVHQVWPRWMQAGWPANVWIGATICNQEEADRDVPKLLQVPARVRFLSVEPMLGTVDLPGLFYYGTQSSGGIVPLRTKGYPQIDWVICGGESGPKARPMHPSWVRSLRDQCAAAGVPFIFKQWGEWVPRSACYHTFEDGKSCVDYDMGATKWPCIRMTESGGDGHRLEDVDGGDDAYMQRVGKKMAGRLLDGKLHDEYPQP